MDKNKGAYGDGTVWDLEFAAGGVDHGSYHWVRGDSLRHTSVPCFFVPFCFAPEADDARALHCDLLLASAAIISGTIAGAHICLFGSETTLACNVAEIENVQYAKTCIPLIMVPFCLSALGYLIIGFLWG